MDEQRLISQVKSGDKSAFKELIEKNQSFVVNTCYRYVKNEEDAHDVAQEVFIEAYEKIEQFRGDSKFSTWLYRIASTRALNFIRNNKKHSATLKLGATENQNLTNIADEKSDFVENEDRKKVLDFALNSLPDNQRIAFTMNKMDEMSYKEIAQTMELSVSSVESLIHRAKKNLQKKLVNYYKKVEV